MDRDFDPEEDGPPLCVPPPPRVPGETVRDPQEDIDTDPPPPLSTRAEHDPPSYTGEPADALLSRIYRALVSPNGELSLIRRDMNALRNVVDRRSQRDEQNWEFVRREVSRACTGVERVEAKLDKIDQRVGELERKVANLEQRLDAIESGSDQH